MLVFVYNIVWPHARILLCLWHVRKAWAGNAMKKITQIEERATVLKFMGVIMYGKGLHLDDDQVNWALQQLDNIANT